MTLSNSFAERIARELKLGKCSYAGRWGWDGLIEFRGDCAIAEALGRDLAKELAVRRLAEHYRALRNQ